MGPSFLAITTLCNVRDNFIEFTIRARVFCFISDRILLLIVILMGLCDMRSNFKNQLHLKLLPEIIFFRMFTLTSPSSGSRFRPQWLAINFSSTGKKTQKICLYAGRKQMQLKNTKTYAAWFISNISTNPFFQIHIRHFGLKLSKYILYLKTRYCVCPCWKRHFCTSYLCSKEMLFTLTLSQKKKFEKIFCFLWFCHTLVHKLSKARKGRIMWVFKLFSGNEIKHTPCKIRNKDYSFCE